MNFQPKARLYLANETPIPAVVAAIEEATDRDDVMALGAKCYEAALELVSRSALSHFVQSAVLASLEDGLPPEHHLQQTLDGLQEQIRQFLADAETSIRYIKLRDQMCDVEGPLQ